ncbi:lipid II flippase Amj family protein [Methylophilaceae bacterium]|nr:lipid II flippase Amj family protein [Methylophilaceae bacterium]
MTLIIAALLASLLVLINFNYFQLLFQHLFKQYELNLIPIAIVKVFFGKKNKLNLVHLEVIPGIWSLSLKKILTSAVAYFFLSTGFLIAFGLAILIPEYRMTVSQSASAFHGIGALILALYIDPMISRSLDIDLQSPKWLENIYSIFVGRLLAYLLALIVLLGLYFYM